MFRMHKQMKKHSFMTSIIYKKIWESEFDNIVSSKDRLQGFNFNQVKLKVNDTYKKFERITTKLEPNDNEDVIYKAHLDKNLSKREGYLSLVGKS